MTDIKQWTKLFKAFGNVSRLRIIALLSKDGEMPVMEIARQIHVTLRGTSKHLLLLHGLGILDRDGRAGQVFYSINRSIDPSAKSLMERFLR